MRSESIQDTLAADAPYAFEAIVATVAPTLDRSMLDLAHGNQRLDNKAPPAEAMRELLPRYLTLALEP